MEIQDAIHVFGDYQLWLIIIGLGFLCATVLPRLLAEYPFAMPIVLLVLGYLAIELPLGLTAPDPKIQGKYAEHLTEIGVIISLMGAGLNIDRPFNFKTWNVTWRLLGITMVITIALAAFVGWAIAAFVLKLLPYC
ncbi:hypothetical protein LZ575_10535 [Antarcticibacterium sp. 1MA-6-2]|uniref:hypothetical protein n=1 Tax=Antarcticibacterium sp. 1MA-6-2 TaxID=2908210 RepID=UPI001F1CA5E1|nr:hypothetical protein [Antarcticibacterium sp. 1MA-6-2]UJH92814.1 hypothetical protein LZ575_10535 [Antarcticibacterium sp. 1MA-6-2]